MLIRTLLVLLVFCTANGVFAETGNGEEDASPSINWISIEEAIALHKKEPKKIMVNLVTEWCAACKQMGKTTYQSEEVIEFINEHFYAVEMDAQMKDDLEFNNETFAYTSELLKGGIHELALHFTGGYMTFPTTIFLDEYSLNPQPVTGFQSVEQLDKLMAFFGENHYKETAWSVFHDFYTKNQDD